MSKVCTKCEIEKNLEEFHNRKDSKDGYRNECKTCRKQKEQKYYINNAEKIKKRTQKYYIDNTEKIKTNRQQYYIDNIEKFKKWHQQYYLNNAEQIRKSCNIYQKEKRRNDTNFKKAENLSILLNKCLKNKQKTSKLEQIFGCKLNFLYQWLAYTAGEDFDWSKYGSIYVVDHCIPRSFYDHTNEFQIKQCWAWKNLRLIKKQENMLKGNKLDLDIRYENASLAEDFLDEYDFQYIIQDALKIIK